MCPGSAVLSDGRTKERTDRQMLWNRQKLNPKGLLMRDNAAGGCEWRVKEEVDYRNPLASKKTDGRIVVSFLLRAKHIWPSLLSFNIPYFPTPTYKKAFSSCLTSWPPCDHQLWLQVDRSWPLDRPSLAGSAGSFCKETE